MTEQISTNSNTAHTVKDTISANSLIRCSLSNKLNGSPGNPTTSTVSLVMCSFESIQDPQSTSSATTPLTTEPSDALEQGLSLVDVGTCTVDYSDSESFDDEDETVYDGCFYLPSAQPHHITTMCPICLEMSVLQTPPCCTFHCCDSCWQAHIAAVIDDGRIKIPCASSECNRYLSRETIVSFVRNDSTLHDRYLKLYAIANQNPRAKTCPRCAHLYSLDATSSIVAKTSKKLPKQVQCSECSMVWCFRCAAPWHENLTCKQFLKGDKLLLKWVNQKSEDQWNARKCPKCSSVIQRAGGCPHMTCLSCECEFCYLCGRRYVKIPFLGQHSSKFSVFGCPYNFHPERPWLRRTIRGLIATGAVAVSPILVVGGVTAAVTVLPPLGIYKLVKRARQRRRLARALLRENTYHFTEDNEDEMDISLQEINRIRRELFGLDQTPEPSIDQISNEDVLLTPFADMDVENLFSDEEKLPADFRTCPNTPAIGAREDQVQDLA